MTKGHRLEETERMKCAESSQLENQSTKKCLPAKTHKAGRSEQAQTFKMAFLGHMARAGGDSADRVFTRSTSSEAALVPILCDQSRVRGLWLRSLAAGCHQRASEARLGLAAHSSCRSQEEHLDPGSGELSSVETAARG
jgi:hypothetical protein